MPSFEPVLELIEPDDQEYSDYAARFTRYNETESGWDIQTYSFVVRKNGDLVAGGRGHVYLGVLEVRGLWVNPDLRGRGVGARLLKEIEDEARKRGATKAWLYTYSWQAEGFYERLGYERYARLDFPHGHYRVDMAKPL